MIIVIQCAGSKNPDAGHLRTQRGQKIEFVGNPEAVPSNARQDDVLYARPDDHSDTEGTWRERLCEYNAVTCNNPLSLLPAFMLYKNAAYKRLADYYGTEHLYILSAGWGLVRSDFQTPHYDITFSSDAEKYKRRYRRDIYCDFNMLPSHTSEPVVFLGGSGYVSLFCTLTEGINSPRIVLYKSVNDLTLPRCKTKKFQTTERYWYYKAANDLIDGKLILDLE